VDVVLFCVKLFDTEDAARAIAPLLSKGGVCITLQNGVDGQHRIGAIVGADHVMGGIAFVSALIESPGIIRYTSKAPSIKFGETDGRMTERAARFRDACVAAGIDAEVVADIRTAQWHKFVGLTVNAALTGLTRKPAGVVPIPISWRLRAPCLRKAQRWPARWASSCPTTSWIGRSRTTRNSRRGCTRPCTTISRAAGGSSWTASPD
jgi:hypothetical protein